MKVGIIGLTNVGKSTLFSALTRIKVGISNFPFCTIEPNIGVVEVPDERLGQIARITKPEKIIPATIEFFDVAGLVKGASQGQGLGNRFLGKMREMDLLIHLVRAFSDESIIHTEGSVNPLRDLELVYAEIALSDLEMAERRLSTLEKMPRSSDVRLQNEVAFLREYVKLLSKGDYPSIFEIAMKKRDLSRECGYLLLKPHIIVLNVSETDLKDGGDLPLIEEIREQFLPFPLLIVCASLEKDLWGLEPLERCEYLQETGLQGSVLERLVREAFRMLNLIVFFTIQSREVRAWPLIMGSTASRAAGCIHSDMERGFIKAEVVPWQALVNSGGWTSAREHGFLKLEGKEYLVQDGDIITFKFQV